jgi:N-acetylneuraminic acid mutarotase
MGADLEPPPGEYGEGPTLPAHTSELAVAEVGRKIYVLGGYPSSPSESQSTVQVFDIDANSWSLGTALPIPIHHPVAVGAAGKLYSLGGQTSGADTGRTFVFDPEDPDLGWVELESMPTPRGAGAGAVIGNLIYVVAGRPGAQNALEVYDIEGEGWTELAPLPDTFEDRNRLTAGAIGDLIYVIGGRYDGGGFGSPRPDSVDIYNPETNSWSSGMPMLRERGGLNGVVAYGCFYVWGGEGQNIGEPNDVYPDHDVYDPVANQWTALDPLPVPIHGVTGAAFVDGLIYMPGGGTQSGGSSGSDLFQIYRPAQRCD